MNKRELIYFNNRRVASVEGDTLYKTMKPEDIYRLTRSIVIAAEVLEKAESLGAVKVEVKMKGTGDIYRTTIHEMRQKGYCDEAIGGDHIFLPIPKWEKTSGGEK